MGTTWSRLLEEEGLLVVVVLTGNVANFLFHVFMSRNLGADGYGALTALLSLLYVLSIPTMTIQASLAQFVSARNAVGDAPAARAYFSGGLLRVGVCAVLVGAVMLSATRPLQGYLRLADPRPVWLLALLTTLTLIGPVFLAGLQGLRLFRPLGGSILVSLTIKCGLGAGLVVLGGAVSSALVAIVLATLAAIAVAHVALHRAWRETPVSGESHTFLPVLRYAIPVTLGFLALAPFANLDIVLARHYLPALEAGRYASAMILGKAFLFLPVGIVLALFPNVAHAVARDEDPRALLWPALALGAALSVAGALICLAVPAFLARVLVRQTDPGIVALVRYVGLVMTPAGLATILLQYHLARRHWACLPGILAVAGGSVLGIARWHGSPVQVLALVGIGSAAVFAVLLGSVWWPRRRATA